MKDKIILFVLPFDTTLVSNWVRAKCLMGFEPEGWRFDYLQYGGINRLIFPFWIYWKILFNNQHRNLLLIKPNNPVLFFLLKTIPKIKLVMDVNDPIHLKNQMGRYSREKAFIMMNLADGIVFESVEYRDIQSEKIRAKSIVIEDNTQQLGLSMRCNNNKKERKKIAVWFGSPQPSEYLIEFTSYFDLLSKYGYQIILMGVSNHVAKYFSFKFDNLILKEKYDFHILMDILYDVSLSFVPMQSIEYFELRGNMKAKLSMACGCITLASNIKMHERLINHGKNGFIFKGLKDFESILNKMEIDPVDIGGIREQATSSVNETFNEKNHAKKIVSYMQSIN